MGKFDTEIVCFRSIKLDVKWGKTSNQTTLNLVAVYK